MPLRPRWILALGLALLCNRAQASAGPFRDASGEKRQDPDDSSPRLRLVDGDDRSHGAQSFLIDDRAHARRARVATLVPIQEPEHSSPPIPEPTGLVVFGSGLLLARPAVRRPAVRATSQRLTAVDRFHVQPPARSPSASAGTLDSWQVEPGPHYEVAKRALDVSLSLLALCLLAPLLLLIAALIKLEDGGPVLFSQWRAGLEGRMFRFYKFRSMCVDAESKRGALRAEQKSESPRFKMKRDPRVTRSGRWLRRYSLDEIPQLWNVVLGDLSLVGPRPALLDEVAEYEPHHHRRLDVCPGVTCTWQVSGRSLVPFEQQVELDLAYIRTRSLRLDMQILLRTVPAVLSGRGAH